MSDQEDETKKDDDKSTGWFIVALIGISLIRVCINTWNTHEFKNSLGYLTG